MSANAALKEQTYIVDAADPVTTAGIAIIRANRTGELAKAFGRPEIARRKVAEKLRSLGHQYDIDAMCLDALERYVEEHGEVPNATKVIASAQILDRLPDPQFDSGHRVVFAINEDGTDFIGASEMGLAIAPGGSTTTSRKGKVDERFGAITKQTLWIMIDFPEKTELDAIEAEQEQAFAAVAEAVADPVTAAENFDQIVAQVQELGSIADIDVAKTIETITNTIEAHSLATQTHTMIESGAATPDNPHVQAITAKIETLTQAVSEQLAKPEAVIPPAVAEMIQAVMETAQPPQVQATAPAQQTVESTAPVAETPAQQNSAASTTVTDFTPEQLQQAPQATATPAAIETPPAGVDTPAISEAKMPPSAPTTGSVENAAVIHTPNAFDQPPPPAALAAQVTAIATQIPPAQNTALTQTVIKQVATAIKNEQPVIAPLQQKVEAVIAKMPEGPAKQDLARVMETVTVKQEVRQHSPAPTPAPATAPTIAKLAFAQPANPVTPSPVPQPKNDNTPSVVPTNKGPTPTISPVPTTVIQPTNAGPDLIVPTTNKGAGPVAPVPVPTGGTGPDRVPTTGPQPSADPQNPPPPQPDRTPVDIRPVADNDIGGGARETLKHDVLGLPIDTSVQPDKIEIKQDVPFEQPVKPCGDCPRARVCFGKACGAVKSDPKEIAQQRSAIAAAMRKNFG